MSDTPQPTQAEIDAQKVTADRAARAERINAKIKELQAYKDTWFVPKTNPDSLPIHVIDYGGIKVGFDGAAVYTFNAEIPGHGRWCPAATEFLANHTKIEKPPVSIQEQEPK